MLITGFVFVYDDKPICIYWEPNEADEDTSLKMEFKFASAADPSLIHITRRSKFLFSNLLKVPSQKSVYPKSRFFNLVLF